ncbi:S24 family peptidase [Facklamia sp. P12934]|uniref:S24 family peptidase n=1 Tax=Facklamia sp. P12934 TaxID=3421948 RepID=UPI003D17F4C9
MENLSKFIGSKIKYFREMKNLTQEEIANDLGITRQTLSRYETGDRKANQDILFELADFFEIKIDDFFPNRKENNITYLYNQLNEPRQNKVYSFAEQQLQEQKSELEYYGQTAAGDPLIGEQVAPIISDSLTVRLLVNGDSMEDLYHDGDIVTYKKQPSLENGEIGIFVLNGGVTMKKFKKNGDIRLQSLNDKYEDIVLTDKDDFTILGKVIK